MCSPIPEKPHAVSFLIIERERYALQLGETMLGGDSDELLATSALASMPPFAVVRCDLNDGTSIRALSSAPTVTVAGQPLALKFRLLNHGDRIAVNDLSILYGDARAAGSTSRIAGTTPDEMALLAGLYRPEGTSDSGGRLTALATGIVYDIPTAGIEIGRDPECAIPLYVRKVSRRHASITPGLLGYTIVDTSANGVLVNGVRIEGARLLGQGDLIRIGEAEFRFAADPANFEPQLPSAVDVSGAATPTVRQATLSRMACASGRVEARANAPLQSVQSTSPAVLLATLEILNDSVRKGMRFRIEKPSVQIGRAAQSDVRLEEDSVSSAHAILVQRGTAWHLRDLGSRNGTYVDGERVTSESVVEGAAEFRFGNVKLLFRPLAHGGDDASKTRGIIGTKKSAHLGRRLR